MKKPADGVLENNKTCYKIFNTLFYTKLTRVMTRNSTEDLEDNSLHQLGTNGSRISSKKVYSSPTAFASTFDFNFLIAPIHTTNHWLTGIIKPRKHDGSSMEPEECLQLFKYF